MLKLTVSGPPGSGTSTLVKGLCHKTGWTSANGGDIFRDHARNCLLYTSDAADDW